MGKPRNEISDAAAGMLAVVVVLGGFVGYALNLWKIAEALDGVFTGVVLLRVIGALFAPLGAILGWF